MTLADFLTGSAQWELIAVALDYPTSGAVTLKVYSPDFAPVLEGEPVPWLIPQDTEY